MIKLLGQERKTNSNTIKMVTTKEPKKELRNMEKGMIIALFYIYQVYVTGRAAAPLPIQPSQQPLSPVLGYPALPRHHPAPLSGAMAVCQGMTGGNRHPSLSTALRHLRHLRALSGVLAVCQHVTGVLPQQ